LRWESDIRNAELKYHPGFSSLARNFVVKDQGKAMAKGSVFIFRALQNHLDYLHNNYSTDVLFWEDEFRRNLPLLH
jgi:hypothetical protein